MKFTINKDIYDLGFNLYSKSNIEINPGVTVLVGCNGAGKSTLIEQIKSNLSKNEINFMSFDNLKEGNDKARSKALFYNDISFLASSFIASEGENIILNLRNVAKECGKYVKDNKESTNPLFFIFDAVDSGLSVDNIIDIKEGLFKTIIKSNKDKDVYIIISSNEYELARESNCFDVSSCKYITFKDYEGYREFIIKSRKNRDKKEEKKQ